MTAPGLAQQPDFFRVAFSAALDLRDRPDNPHNGTYLGISLARYDDRERGVFNFSNYAAEARQYVSLGSPARVVALRFLTSMDDSGTTSRVPFYYQQTLGGSDTLRGFREYRFRDRRLLYMSGEYRWEMATAIEFVVFYDAGKVFSDRSNFDFTGLRKNIGYGIRFKTPDSVIFRVDIGHSSEGKRIYFKFGPSF
jgi:outer membrane protein assembly factor BamA